jgi:hypothetical protein
MHLLRERDQSQQCVCAFFQQIYFVDEQEDMRLVGDANFGE